MCGSNFYGSDVKLFILEPIICFIGKWVSKLKSVAGADDGRYITAWESLSAASTDDWNVKDDLTKEQCEEKLGNLTLDKQSYPTQIRAYLLNEAVKYVMIWEIKKVASDVNTQWEASCSLPESMFEDKITECEQKGYQVFHVHKDTNRFIRR